MEAFEHFKRAIDMFGGDTKLAKALGCTQNAVWQARKRKSVSPKMAAAIERATDRAVRASQLRPDVFTPDEISQPEDRLAS